MTLGNAMNPAPQSTTVGPLVSVIMNCHNGEKYLRESIDSVFAQTYSNFEIIFWDNASTDRSAAIAKSYRDDRMRYFTSTHKVPLGRARNFAISKAKGKLIAFLDCDDLWLPEKTAKQIPLFEDPDVALVYSDALFFNANIERRLYSTVAPRRGYCFAELLNDYFLSMESVILRRSALVGLNVWFSPDFSFIEEYDLFVRIGLAWKIDYVPEVLAKWRVHGESLSWRFPEGFVEERRVMLARLQESPAVMNLHYAALRSAWSIQLMREARLLWRSGDSRGARAMLRRASHWTAKHYIFYLSSYFPWRLVERVQIWITKVVVPTATP